MELGLRLSSIIGSTNFTAQAKTDLEQLAIAEGSPLHIDSDFETLEGYAYTQTGHSDYLDIFDQTQKLNLGLLSTSELFSLSEKEQQIETLFDQPFQTLPRKLSRPLQNFERQTIRRELLEIFTREIAAPYRSNTTLILPSLTPLNSKIDQYASLRSSIIAIDDATPEPEELMPNCSGVITRLDFQYVSDMDLLHFQSADEQFDQDVEFTLAVGEWVDLKIFDLRKINGQYFTRSGRLVEVIQLPSNYFWVRYARDARVVFNNGSILHNLNYQKAEMDVMDAIANRVNKPMRSTYSIYFEGGNMRCSDNLLFVGVNDIIQTVERNPEIHSRDEAVQLFETKFGKKVFVVGDFGLVDDEQPGQLFHIDVFLTVLNDYEVIIGRLPEDNWLHQYLENITQRIQAQIPQLTVYRLDIPVLDFRDLEVPGMDPFVFSFNNMLVETHKTNYTETLRFYMPYYDFSQMKKALKAEIDRLFRVYTILERSAPIVTDQYLIENDKDPASNSLDSIGQQILKAENFAKKVQNLDEAAFNQKHYDQVRSFFPHRFIEIRPIKIDALQLMSFDGNGAGNTGWGGSLNCLVNETRSVPIRH